jgi:hypothetical protein
VIPFDEAQNKQILIVRMFYELCRRFWLSPLASRCLFGIGIPRGEHRDADRASAFSGSSATHFLAKRRDGFLVLNSTLRVCAKDTLGKYCENSIDVKIRKRTTRHKAKMGSIKSRFEQLDFNGHYRRTKKTGAATLSTFQL